jgi:uncharacterized protein YegP (UPF0339 family)
MKKLIIRWMSVPIQKSMMTPSKAMDSMGAVKTIISIRNNCPNAFFAEIVTDKDLATKFNLSHSNSELIATGRMTKAER